MSKETLTSILSPETLSQITNFNLLAKVAVEGFMSGLHRSLNHGNGTEFMQYRSYTQGDELKCVDWKVYGRSDRFYTRLYHEETNMNCTFVLDGSASLAYKGERAVCSKFHYGSMLASSLIYLASRQGDSPGLFCYNDTCLSHIQASSSTGHVQRILGNIASLSPSNQADHTRYLTYLAGTLRRRGMLVIISDFLDPETDYVALFKQLGFGKHDCLAIQILDKDELDLPFRGTTKFHDSETNEEIVTAASSIRDDYSESIQSYCDSLRDNCLKAGIDYLFTDTSEPIGEVLATYLKHRDSRQW